MAVFHLDSAVVPRVCKIITVVTILFLSACGSSGDSDDNAVIAAQREQVYTLTADHTNSETLTHPLLRDVFGECLSAFSASCENENGDAITRFKQDVGFVGKVFGLADERNLALDLDPLINNERFSKYSGPLATFSTKHHPFAVASGRYTYFVYSGPAVLDQSDVVLSTAGGGDRSSSPLFQRGDGLTNALGIYVARFNHESQRVSKPILLHVKHTDDPHDNAVVNFDRNGNLFVLVSGRGARRSAKLFYLSRPDEARVFSSGNIVIKDISPDNLNYRTLGIDSINVPSYAPITYPHLLSTSNGLRLVYTLYCFGVSPSCGQGTRQIWTAQLQYNEGDDQATLENVEPLVAYEGHYFMARVADNGNDIGIAFTWHAGGVVDNRTNLYFLHSRDSGQSWRYFDVTTGQSESAESILPISSFTDMNATAGITYTTSGQDINQHVYLKDLLLFNNNGEFSPLAYYLVSARPDAVPPSANNAYSTFVTYWSEQQWNTQYISDEQDHNYSSGALLSIDDMRYITVFPATPPGMGNALAGGVPAQQVFELGGDVFSPEYTASLLQPFEAGYLRDLCEVNYIKGVEGQASDDFVVFASAGNPYQFVSSVVNQQKANAPMLFMNKQGIWYQLPKNIDSADQNDELAIEPLSVGQRLDCGYGG